MHDGAGPDAGAAFSFLPGADGWKLEHAFLPDVDDPVRFHGQSISLDGTHALIGSPGDALGIDDAGSAFLYRIGPDGNWAPACRLTSDRPVAAARFGSCLQIDRDMMLIGRIDDPDGLPETGHVWLFRHAPVPDEDGPVRIGFEPESLESSSAPSMIDAP